MPLKFSNFAKTSLSAHLEESDTVLSLAAASLFPEGAFTAVIWDSSKSSPLEDPAREIIYAERTGNAVTAQRAKENTSAKAWSQGSAVANVITAETMNTILSGSTSSADDFLSVTSGYYQMTQADRRVEFVCSEETPEINVMLPSAAVCKGAEFILINTSADYRFYVSLNTYGTENIRGVNSNAMRLYAGSTVRLLSDGAGWLITGLKTGAHQGVFSVTAALNPESMIMLPYAEIQAGAGLGSIQVDASEISAYVFIQTYDCMNGIPLTVTKTDSGTNTVSVVLSNGIHRLNRQGDSVTVTADSTGSVYASAFYAVPSVITVSEETMLTYGEKLVVCDASASPFTIFTNYAHECTGQETAFVKTDNTANVITIYLVAEGDSGMVTLGTVEPKAVVVSDGTKWHRLV